MILLLDTSTPTCHLTLMKDNQHFDYSWEADRELAKGLLGFLRTHLDEHNVTWTDLTGLVAFQGPGSFTGLRIGLTVLNTLADSEAVPIVGTTGEDWQEVGVARLKAGENDEIVLPHYGSEANITQPRK
jgi:tRNA threonylcarbamoyladenosine biosynthesis protein TsaB